MATNILAKAFKPTNILLAVVVAVAALLRLFHISDPIGGYHGFNEAFYSMNAQYYLTHSIFGLLTDPVDTANPPLINFLLWISYSLFGFSEFSSRLVTSAFSVLSVIFIFKLGKLFYNDRVGLAAAAFLAVSPGFLLAGRNIQTDSILIFFMLAGTYYYGLSISGYGTKHKIVSAILFALGMLTKLVTVLVLVPLLIWEIYRYRNLRFLLGKDHLLFVGVFFACALPWFLIQTLNKDLVSGQSALASNAFSSPDIFFFLNSFIPEVMWGLSPVLFVLFPIAVFYLIKERKEPDILVGLTIAAFFIFYLFFHFHSYYLLPLIPLVVLAVARMVDKLLPQDTTFTAVVIPLVIISCFFAILLMSGNKYGHKEFSELQTVIDPTEQNIVIETTDLLWGSFSPIITYYFPNAKVLRDQPADFPKDKKLYFVNFTNSENAEPNVDRGICNNPIWVKRTNSNIIMPIVFGKAIYQIPYGMHFFRPAGFIVQTAVPSKSFGFIEFPVEQNGLTIRYCKEG